MRGRATLPAPVSGRPGVLTWTGTAYVWTTPLRDSLVLVSQDGAPLRWTTAPGSVASAASASPDQADEGLFLQGGAVKKATLRTIDREIRRTRSRRGVHVEEDFLTDAGTTTAGQGRGLETNDAGASTTSSAVSETDHPGQVTSTTGTTGATSGASYQIAGSDQIRFGGGTWWYEIECKIPTLSTSGQRYAVLIGFWDVTNSLTQIDAACLVYDEGGILTGSPGGSANWYLLTSAGSTRTFTATTVAVGTSWTTLRIEVAADASSVEAFVDGVSVATSSTNIPSTASQLVGAGWQIKKSIGTLGRTIVVDYHVLDGELSAARG